MKKLLTVFLIMGCVACSGSDDEGPTPEPLPNTPANCVRTGAICKDGTTSTSTGSGACSHYGGVSSWICK